jgi:hypothetical protein
MTDSSIQVKIDAIIARFFSAFDNRNGALPQLSNLAICFTPKAVITRRANSETDLYTVEEFAIPRIELLNGGTLLDFHEAEISSTTQIFDGIAVRISRYRKSGLLNGDNYAGAGTKCFQLVELNSGWRIASLAWVDDDNV